MRDCPICGENGLQLHLLLAHELTYGGTQRVASCSTCGMVYSDQENPVDYSKSIYSQPMAYGSGESETDRKRHLIIAETLKHLCYCRTLDIGCGQGGLLEALWDQGFRMVSGMDPDPECCRMAQIRGLSVFQGSLPCELPNQYDLIILSHVLEHIPDPSAALKSVVTGLSDGGTVYVEVPDASRYWTYDAPNHDFNSEHINHFDFSHLFSLLSAHGLSVISSGQKTIDLPNSSDSPPIPYPAFWVIAQQNDDLSTSVFLSIAKSRIQLSRINEYLGSCLEGRNVTLYGCNSWAGNIANLPNAAAAICQCVDRNQNLWGRKINGIPIQPPSEINPENIILIGSLIAIESIKEDIKKMGLSNPIIKISPEVYRD